MRNILNVTVSVFESVFSNRVEFNASLYDWLKYSDEKICSDMKFIRKSIKSVEARERKLSLPAITPSGVFDEIRSTNTLKKHSGLICIDIDQKDNPTIKDWKLLKRKLSKELAYIAYISLSASAKGLFLIIPIEDPAKHKDYFALLEQYFVEEWGIKIDKHCKDVTRLRLMSYDPAAYFNLEAKILNITLAKKSETDFRGDFTHHFTSNEQTLIKRYERQILRTKIDITDGYQNWFMVGCVIFRYFGKKGASIFQNFSKFNPEYDFDESQYQYQKITESKKPVMQYGIGSLIQLIENIQFRCNC